jgi:hypothetical protein
VEGSFEAPFGGVYVDATADDEPAKGPQTWTLTIGGRAVLAQEVAEFSVARTKDGGGPLRRDQTLRDTRRPVPNQCPNASEAVGLTKPTRARNPRS